jgi:DNA-binding IscR family transcriptional regulator
MLKDAPENYTVGMILRQTEGSLSLVSYDGADSVERESVLVRLWTQLEEAIDSVVDNITLKDMVEWHTDKANDYVI